MPMSAYSSSRQRVRVERGPFFFIVHVDAQPVLRCTARREAFRYAVLVRRALRQPDEAMLTAEYHFREPVLERPNYSLPEPCPGLS